MLFISKYLPKSLFIRFVMIIILPSLLFQVIAVCVFYQRHWSSVVAHTSQLIANNIIVIDNLIGLKQLELAKQSACQFNITFETISNYGAITNIIHATELSALYENLAHHFSDYKIVENDGELSIFVNKGETTWRFNTSIKPLVNPTTYVFVAWLLCLNLAMIGVSILFAKNQIRSILELTRAADNFGKGLQKSNFKPSGASEIRLAGLAFIKMREKLGKQLDKHTKMLAMISHDLKTPLTRLKLQLELTDNIEQASEMKDDIKSMQQMIDSYLHFARGELINEFSRLDLVSFIKDYLQQQIAISLKISFTSTHNQCYALINTPNFTRVLDNIISNSQKYAKKVHISLYTTDKIINLEIEDDGAGVQDHEKAMLLIPFYRADKARHLDKSGNVGLGLAIANEIVKEHGGTIEVLSSTRLGGLMLRINLQEA